MCFFTFTQPGLTDGNAAAYAGGMMPVKRTRSDADRGGVEDANDAVVEDEEDKEDEEDEEDKEDEEDEEDEEDDHEYELELLRAVIEMKRAREQEKQRQRQQQQ
eukprot:g429.t1